MSKAILDSSAILASFYGEVGAETVDALMRGAAVSAVNASEVIAKLVERGMPAPMARSALGDTGVEIIPFDLDQAEIAGALRTQTRHHGLSLGDRACLGLAKLIGGRAITADRAWTGLGDLGIEIVVIRGDQ